MDAPCSILSASEKSFYDNLEHEEPNMTVPQRPNLVYAEGYPRGATWSWKIFGNNSKFLNIPPDMFDKLAQEISDEIQDNLDFMPYDIKEIVRKKLEEKGRISVYTSYSKSSSN